MRLVSRTKTDLPKAVPISDFFMDGERFTREGCKIGPAMSILKTS